MKKDNGFLRSALTAIAVCACMSPAALLAEEANSCAKKQFTDRSEQTGSRHWVDATGPADQAAQPELEAPQRSSLTAGRLNNALAATATATPESAFDASVRAPGNTCSDPIVVTLPAQMQPTFVDANTTCGHLNDTQETCLGYYDGGEDIFYRLDVTVPVCIQMTLTADTPYTGMGISETCPLGGEGECLAVSSINNDGGTIVDLALEPGSYYVMVDTWPSPDCTNYTLEIAWCDTGACCTGSSCAVGTQTACAEAGGLYLGTGTNCDESPCSTGACCNSLTGGCEGQLSEEDCAALGDTNWTPGFSCLDGSHQCAQPGDDCSAPVLLSLPADMTSGSFTEINTTCGHGNNYSDTCLTAYDEHEDIIYEITVTEEMCVNISLDADNVWGGMALLDGCPDTGVCIAQAATYDSAPDVISSVLLTPGVYYLMVDSNVTQCINYTLDISVCPEGACCLGDMCSIMSPAACEAAGGNYLGDDSTCDGAPCSTGACCDPTSGTCIGDISEADCLANDGAAWNAGLSCSDGDYVCPLPGDNCNNPLRVEVPADLAPTYVDANTTCGHGDDYTDNCLGFYATGEDVIYELTVTEPMCLNFDLQSDSFYSAIAIDDRCGPDGSCIASAASFDSNESITNLFLEPGVYTIMIDQWNPCLDNYTLTISACPQGACCLDGACSYGYEAECVAAGGSFVGVDVPCGPNTCNEGGCCYNDGSCGVTDGPTCTTNGGVYRGDGTSCSPNECPLPGDDCTLPLPIAIPAEFGFTSADSTCGRGNDYDATCLDGYDGGEDAIYELSVTTAVCVDITLTTDSFWAGMAIDDICPIGEVGQCEAVAAYYDEALIESFRGLLLAPGVYYLMVDNYTTEGCMDYTLEVNPCPVGACCSAEGCMELSEAECTLYGGVYAGDETACSPVDCNGNDLVDICEVVTQTAPDCNGNMLPDACDIGAGASNDCNDNSIPDECDGDCNGNGYADECDIIFGTSNDCQPDGVPDECQLGDTKSLRSAEYAWDDGSIENSLGIDSGRVVALNHFVAEAGATTIETIRVAWGNVPAEMPVTLVVWSDPDQDGSPADAQVLGSVDGTVQTPNTGTFVDYTVPSVSVGSAGASFFVGFAFDSTAIGQLPIGLDENGVITDEGWIVGDLDGLVDLNDLGNGAYTHSLTQLANAGFPANVMIRANASPGDSDCNGNLVPDACDIAGGTSADCDLNGVADECEFLDCDSNGVHDPCDILAGADDCDADGVPDTCQMAADDCNADNILDECQIGADPDCNGNGVLDECDISTGASDDCMPDGIPDECQLGDVSGPNLLEDPSFEEGDPNPYWTIGFDWVSPMCTLDTCGTGLGTAGPRTGDWWVWLGGTAGQEEASVSQDVKIPYGEVSTLEFYLWHGVSGGEGEEDTVEVSMDGDVLLTISETETDYFGGYHRVLVDVTPYNDGEFHTVKFTAYSHNAGITNFSLDDVAVIVGPYSNDCNANGMPDECENDCDGDGIPDDCDTCGDLDNDEDVDYGDYLLFLNAFGRSLGEPDFLGCADFDDTATVGLGDYTVWLTCYRNFVGSPMAAPPQPPANNGLQVEKGDSLQTPVGQDLNASRRPAALQRR